MDQIRKPQSYAYKGNGNTVQFSDLHESLRRLVKLGLTPEEAVQIEEQVSSSFRKNVMPKLDKAIANLEKVLKEYL